jgi:hypothetical protein
MREIQGPWVSVTSIPSVLASGDWACGPLARIKVTNRNPKWRRPCNPTGFSNPQFSTPLVVPSPQENPRPDPHPTRKNLFSHPATVPTLAAGYLGLTYLAILIVDVLQIGTAQAWIGDRFNQGIMWHFLFGEKGFVEIAQWTTLAGLGVTAAILSGKLFASGDLPAARFWRLFAILGAWLAVEDAGSWRFNFAAYTTRILDLPQAPYHYLAEGFYYAAIAAIPVYALIRYWRVTWESPSRWWLAAGFVLYGLAASFSVTRYFGYWYQRTGNWFLGVLGEGTYQNYRPRGSSDPGPGHWFMDFVVEESMELMAAALLVAAAVAYLRYHAQRRPDALRPSDPDL